MHVCGVTLNCVARIVNVIKFSAQFKTSAENNELYWVSGRKYKDYVYANIIARENLK